MAPSAAMKASPATTADARLPVQRFWFSFVLLTGVLGLLFIKSFFPGIIHFANDGPLGAIAAEQARMPSAFTGVWIILNWVGSNVGGVIVNVIYSLLWLLGPVGFAKFHAPISVLVLGLSAWLAFRQLKFSPATYLAGSLAATLNGGFFSYACWGLGALSLTVAAF